MTRGQGNVIISDLLVMAVGSTCCAVFHAVKTQAFHVLKRINGGYWLLTTAYMPPSKSAGNLFSIICNSTKLVFIQVFHVYYKLTYMYVTECCWGVVIW